MQSKLLLFAVIGFAGTCLVSSAADNSPLVYDRDIRPILSENCFPCHGQDSKKRMANLRLDSFEGATAIRGAERAAIVPGKPEMSLMVQRITAAEKSRRMPPAFSNRTLNADQIALLTRWIAEGGQYSEHWAFLPPRLPEVPHVSGYVHGASDDYGFNVVEGGVHIHDLQATVLYLLGIDHLKLTYLSQGRRFRLTDVAGSVVKEVVA